MNPNPITSIAFNEDDTRFACTTKSGFLVYNTDPIKECFHRAMPGEMPCQSLIELYQKSNIVFLVKPDLTTLMIWEDRQNKSIAELSFTANIINIKCRNSRLMVQTQHKIHIYQFENLAQLTEIVCTSPIVDFIASDVTVVAFPDRTVGTLHLNFINDLKLTKSINVHNHAISKVALSKDGMYVATCSVKGTLIRIWNTHTGVLERELRRGLENAVIQTLHFNQNGSSLIVFSDKGTIHLYSMTQPNKKSNLAFMNNMLPHYFKSEWSLVSISHNLGEAKKSLITFGNAGDTIIIIDDQGHYTKYSIANGEIRLIESMAFTTSSAITN